MIEICTMTNDFEKFVEDMRAFIGKEFESKIFHIEFIDDEISFVKFKTILIDQEIFDLSIYCGKQEMKRTILNE